MTPEAIFKRLEDKFGGETIFDYHADPKKDRDPWFQVAPWEIETVCEHLRSNADFACDYLECITGVDYPDDKKIHVVYHVYSYVKCPRLADYLPQLISFYRSHKDSVRQQAMS